MRSCINFSATAHVSADAHGPVPSSSYHMTVALCHKRLTAESASALGDRWGCHPAQTWCELSAATVLSPLPDTTACSTVVLGMVPMVPAAGVNGWRGSCTWWGLLAAIAAGCGCERPGVILDVFSWQMVGWGRGEQNLLPSSYRRLSADPRRAGRH